VLESRGARSGRARAQNTGAPAPAARVTRPDGMHGDDLARKDTSGPRFDDNSVLLAETVAAANLSPRCDPPRKSSTTATVSGQTNGHSARPRPFVTTRLSGGRYEGYTFRTPRSVHASLDEKKSLAAKGTNASTSSTTSSAPTERCCAAVFRTARPRWRRRTKKLRAHRRTRTDSCGHQDGARR